jgi:putative transposase
MAIKLKHSNVYCMYSITFTCYDWMHLFEITKSYDLEYKWFNYLRENNKAEVICYVIMPNHIHLILYFKNEHFDLNKIIGNAKRFIAYEIIKRLIQQNESEILLKLSEGVSEREKKKGQLHKVFEESFDAKAIFSERFMLQKINYMHLNPVRKGWSLVLDYLDYKHSSASFYELGKVNLFKPIHYNDLQKLTITSGSWHEPQTPSGRNIVGLE